MTAACCSGEPWREVAGGKLDCESAAWAGITDWAKRLMRLPLHKSPNKRITAAAALQHPCVTAQAGAQELPYLPGKLPKVSSSTRPCTPNIICALSALHQEHCTCGPKRTLHQAWLSSCYPCTEHVLLGISMPSSSQSSKVITATSCCKIYEPKLRSCGASLSSTSACLLSEQAAGAKSSCRC